jgi:hypothetical protein
MYRNSWALVAFATYRNLLLQAQAQSHCNGKGNGDLH